MSNTIELDRLTYVQAKLLNNVKLFRNGETLVGHKDNSMNIDIPVDPGYNLPVPNKPITFHYMEEPDELDSTVYWCCAISTQINMFTKKRRVIVLKVGRHDNKGNDVELDDKNPFENLSRQYVH